MDKRRSATELVNFFPTWSRVRTDDQSIGFQFFDALAFPIDKMDKYLERMKWNQYLPTVNLDEVDLLYRVQLPTTYTFTYDTSDALVPVEAAPTVQGTIGSSTYDVSIAGNNDIETLWYDALPTRADLEETITGLTNRLISQPVSDFPWSGSLSHHLSGGHLWVEASSGPQYVSVNDDGEVDRGTVILHGTTRKGTEETEILTFAWDEKRHTLKEWEEITRIDTYDMEDGVQIDIRSGDIDNGPYWAFYNLRYSENDNKVDEFWDLGGFARGSTLDRVGHISDEWQNLMFGFSEKAPENRWELLNDTEQNISAVDMTIQPFTDRCWVIDQDANLYCYSLGDTIASGVDFLRRRDDGPEIRLEFSERYVLFGEDISVTPVQVRALKTIDRYRMWYETPLGVKYGLLDGVAVAYTSDFWVYPSSPGRQLEQERFVIAEERGEYKFALEAVFSDEEEQSDRVSIPVQYKLPLTTIDLSSNMPGETMSGLDFSIDQQLWVGTDSPAFYRFSFHTDLMVVDYTDKVVYLKEDYDSVEIT
jgi:hypothetical protein